MSILGVFGREEPGSHYQLSHNLCTQTSVEEMILFRANFYLYFWGGVPWRKSILKLTRKSCHESKKYDVLVLSKFHCNSKPLNLPRIGCCENTNNFYFSFPMNTFCRDHFLKPYLKVVHPPLSS